MRVRHLQCLPFLLPISSVQPRSNGDVDHLQAMFLALSLCTAIAGVTGAASITRWFADARQGAHTTKNGGLSNSSSAEFPFAVLTADCPRPQGASPQLINSLLDDVEISLRSLRREKPGPSRRCSSKRGCLPASSACVLQWRADDHLVCSCKVMNMVNRYSPSLQPQGHHMRDMGSVHAYVAAMARAKAAPLLAEDAQSAHRAAKAGQTYSGDCATHV